MQDDKEKKRLELLERKKENQRLLDEESARIKGRSQKEAASGGKMTRAQIEEVLENELQQQQELKPKGKVFVEEKCWFRIKMKLKWRSDIIQQHWLFLGLNQSIFFTMAPPLSCFE